MKIGLYGGTFDPIHHGHLILARTALEEMELDSIIFIPAAISPHKLETSPTPSAIRWEMILASIDGEAGILADPYELELAGPSFTYDTVLHYRKKFPDAELFYFIGYDNLEKLDTWHRIEELKSLVTLVVLDRGAASGTIPFPQIFRRYDISASDIRNRVAKGLSIRYLVTPPVDDLIRRHHLYQPHSH
ncbi:MAG: nicotinate (nicotinamide) nucleotide adenylyltransferase [Chthoniobacterales bacterium]